MYNIELTNTTNDEKVILNNSHDCLQFESEKYDLNKKIKNARNRGFLFIRRNTLTTKI